MNSKIKKAFIAGTGITGIYLLMRGIAKRKAEDAYIDQDNPYRSLGNANSESHVGIYRGAIKPIFDHIFSFAGLLLLSPLFTVISAAVWGDDPGPVLFMQKRIGKDKKFFYCHKFRTMKMSTPHDVPTHQLADPEQYITRVGRILRMTSLDELPQIWDIFRGKMSVVGPRPALWNQEDLVFERDKYGANDLTPGLTGWAQINGRDELEIPIKAKYDGVYAQALKAGGRKGFMMDLKCFVGTLRSVAEHDGVVEGGTGAME